jgi:catechol 2,3-dioxygenase-like lactoylglutathione lyase family enzyme
MIDHVSIAVRDLDKAAAFYDPVMRALDFARLVTRENTVGYGKKYAEFWLNVRPAMAPVPADGGCHVCLRTRTREQVDAFHRAAVAGGAADDGRPGLRAEYSANYYAAFIRDPDGNRVEAVTFLEG